MARVDLEDCMDDLSNAMTMLRPVAKSAPESAKLKGAHDRLTRDVAVLVLVLDDVSRTMSEDSGR
ncbi:hypothetical protein LWF15_02990 [Kineosporia rhizophila]|uniref:hypothetical protein n=1 Tax=Kineosporia TaxID=49184 RepID=UPI000A845E3A|nr:MULTISPECIES: hypothetical protein [Kineosporia]MCE0534464.1 hypothetical protein [Kineosporia rhizophila]GLY13998.1 hypothetical protein Kisp01_10140 [Kineosporia sp. NBRC 101677]